jgi:MYXO-CTERM domain-containing protein
VAPGTRKILPDSAMPPETAISLRAARNEWEPFQIVVRDAGGVPGVDVDLTDLCAFDGSCLPATDARLYRELYLEVTEPSPFGLTLHEREPGLYPDPLVPFTDPYADGDVPVGAPFDLAPGETGTVFVDWYVPTDAAPGQYWGNARVAASDGRLTELPITLTVWPFALPMERTIATAFKLIEGGSGIRAYHGGPDGEPNDEFDAIVYRYQHLLHEHRLDPTYINGPMDFTFDEGGTLLPVDWTEYDARVGPWLEGTRFPDGVAVTRFDVHRFRPGKGTGELTEDQYLQAAAAFAEHLADRGWWDRAYVYAHDEPWNPKYDTAAVYAQINDDMALLLRASDLWQDKVLVTGPLTDAIEGDVGIWCPDTTMYDAWSAPWAPYAGWDDYTAHLDRGGELWFYTCRLEIPPYAGYDIDTPIGHEPRIVAWGAWFERATGLLYWCVNCWVDYDPYHVFANHEEEVDARNGNGFLLYPGDHDGRRDGAGSPDWLSIDGPIPSFRLKQIRDGLEDWELFHMATELGAEDVVREQVRRAYTRFGTVGFIESCTSESPHVYCPDDQPWTLDEETLQDARRQVASAIVEITAPPEPEGCGGCRSEPSGAVVVLALLGPWLRRRRPHDRGPARTGGIA